MSDTVLVGIFGPLTLLLVGFILSEVVKPLINPSQKDTAPAPLVGEAVTGTSQSGWEVAYEGIVRELADEHNDHLTTVEAHKQCHALMLEHGLDIPGGH